MEGILVLSGGLLLWYLTRKYTKPTVMEELYHAPIVQSDDISRYGSGCPEEVIESIHDGSRADYYISERNKKINNPYADEWRDTDSINQPI